MEPFINRLWPQKKQHINAIDKSFFEMYDNCKDEQTLEEKQPDLNYIMLLLMQKAHECIKQKYMKLNDDYYNKTLNDDQFINDFIKLNHQFAEIERVVVKKPRKTSKFVLDYKLMLPK
jgi:hypothetical protein